MTISNRTHHSRAASACFRKKSSSSAFTRASKSIFLLVFIVPDGSRGGIPGASLIEGPWVECGKEWDLSEGLELVMIKGKLSLLTEAVPPSSEQGHHPQILLQELLGNHLEGLIQLNNLDSKRMAYPSGLSLLPQIYPRKI